MVGEYSGRSMEASGCEGWWLQRFRLHLSPLNSTREKGLNSKSHVAYVFYSNKRGKNYACKHIILE